MCKTDYGGGGGKNVPKIDYVICERPHSKSHKVCEIAKMCDDSVPISAV